MLRAIRGFGRQPHATIPSLPNQYHTFEPTVLITTFAVTVLFAVNVAAIILFVSRSKSNCERGRPKQQRKHAIRCSCCPPKDGDADVWKNRGATFDIMFSLRDPSSKRTNPRAELLESTVTAREDHVSSEFRHGHMRASFSFVSRTQTQDHFDPTVSFAYAKNEERLHFPVDVP